MILAESAQGLIDALDRHATVILAATATNVVLLTVWLFDSWLERRRRRREEGGT